MGSGAWPAGATFARDGVVLVSINYRLGAFGFLHLDKLFEGFEGSGNLGIRDQVHALRWVQRNIGAFGGDASNVTVFGESAGAISVGTLLALPAAAGLFRRAILQSGAAHHARSSTGATLVARRFCEILGIEPGDERGLLRARADQIREATIQLMFSESARVADLLAQEDPLAGNTTFCPVVDGTWLPRRPIDAIRAGSATGVDLLIGTNEDEWRLVAFGMGADAARALPAPNLERLRAGTRLSGAELLEAYRSAVPGKSDLDLYCDIQSDQVFTVPARRLADAQAGHAALYCYRFAWPAPIMGGILGACHALEIPFVFDQLQQTSVLVGEAAPQSLADVMHLAWISFMRDGLPAAPGLASWPRYDAVRRPTMRLDRHCEVAFDLNRERIRLWPDW